VRGKAWKGPPFDLARLLAQRLDPLPNPLLALLALEGFDLGLGDGAKPGLMLALEGLAGGLLGGGAVVGRAGGGGEGGIYSGDGEFE
jgi:hypothetical protein